MGEQPQCRLTASMIGEDGKYGGSPCVDVHLKGVNIDLGGLPILEDGNLVMVRGASRSQPTPGLWASLRTGWA
jgi:hypothetical protein